MKTKVNYRGAYIPKTRQNNITRAIKSYNLENDQEQVLNLYVRNTVYPRHTVTLFPYEIETFDKYGISKTHREIIVISLVRNQTQGSAGNNVPEMVYVEDGRIY